MGVPSPAATVAPASTGPALTPLNLAPGLQAVRSSPHSDHTLDELSKLADLARPGRADRRGVRECEIEAAQPDVAGSIAMRLLIAAVVWVAAVFGAVAVSNTVAGSIHNKPASSRAGARVSDRAAPSPRTAAPTRARSSPPIRLRCSAPRTSSTRSARPAPRSVPAPRSRTSRCTRLPDGDRRQGRQRVDFYVDANGRVEQTATGGSPGATGRCSGSAQIGAPGCRRRSPTASRPPPPAGVAAPLYRGGGRHRSWPQARVARLPAADQPNRVLQGVRGDRPATRVPAKQLHRAAAGVGLITGRTPHPRSSTVASGSYRAPPRRR